LHQEGKFKAKEQKGGKKHAPDWPQKGVVINLAKRNGKGKERYDSRHISGIGLPHAIGKKGGRKNGEKRGAVRGRKYTPIKSTQSAPKATQKKKKKEKKKKKKKGLEKKAQINPKKRFALFNKP